MANDTSKSNNSDPISSNTDTYAWVGSTGGAWGSASNWIDTTTFSDADTAVPGSNNRVFIAGPASGTEVIVDGGSSASLTLRGGLLLSGQYATGALTIGYHVSSTPAGTLTVGNVTLANGSSLTASTVNVAYGSLTLNSGTSLMASDLVQVGVDSSYDPSAGTL